MDARPFLAIALFTTLPAQWRDMPALFRREEPAVAYDPGRDHVVLFGGQTGNALLDDTWVWNGRTWRPRRTSVAPPGRYSHRLVYDPSRGTILLFGGTKPGGPAFGDTWEFDGRSWRQVAASGPAPRANFGMAFDPVRKRVVLFGGFSWTQGNLGDTWEWDGRAWQQMQPTQSPGFLKGCGMQWEPVSRRVVLFGGSNGFVRIPATWAWDGRDWTLISNQGPSVLGEHSDVVWDAATGRLLVQTQPRSPRPPYPHSTYTFDGARWVDAKPVAGTEGNFGWSRICEDPVRKQVIHVHDTRGAGTPLRTSAWDGTTWRVAYEQPDVPYATHVASVAFDEARDEYVLIGAGMWRLGGTRYQRVAWSSAPVPSDQAAVAYHRGSERVVLYSAGKPCDRETWLWDGVRWTRSPSPQRPPQYCPGQRLITYDAVADRLILVTASAQGTWQWKPIGGWSPLPAANPPTYRWGHSIAHDPVHDRLVLFGGYDGNRSTHFGDTWEWDGARWSQRQPKTTPPPRERAPMAYVPELGGVVMAGGWDFSPRDDVWLWNGTDWRRLPDIQRKYNGSSPIVDLAYDPGRKELRVFTIGGNGGVQIWSLDTLQPNLWHPRPGENLDLSIQLPQHAGDPFAVGLAFGTHPGIPLRVRPKLGVERFPLRADPLLAVSLGAGLAGQLDAQGRGAIRLPIPNQPWFVGLDLHAAALTLSPARQVGGITNSVSVEIIR